MFKISGKEEVLNFSGFDFKYILKNRSYDTNHLIVVFSGFGAKSNFTYDFKKSLQSNRSYVLWIKDDFYGNNQATYYLDPPYKNTTSLEQAIIQFIKEVMSFLEVENCTLLGASKGGSSALYYGIKYNFKNILVSAPTLLIGSSVAGIIPKGNPKAVAKFMLGDSLSRENTLKLDSYILEAIKDDQNLDKNIYLLSSPADNRYNGQIAPFLGLFYKYFNFNYIESHSVLVRKHQDVTSYNAPLILSILNCLTFNLTTTFTNSIISGDRSDAVEEITKEPILEVNKLGFDSAGRFYPEGIFFLRGLSCANYSDLKYELKLKAKDKDYEYITSLAKDNDTNISKKYYNKAFINYDKAHFCTFKHQGLDLSEVPDGSYQLFIKIQMATGDTCELPMVFKEGFHTDSCTNDYIQSISCERDIVIYKKQEV
ncbi:hypothetical protein [Psychrobacter celer]|uniref:hypothetical protein n=1 Tax=Psychrobacter celer TaxID=306572 RepID=UPI003FD41A61